MIFYILYWKMVSFGLLVITFSFKFTYVLIFILKLTISLLLYNNLKNTNQLEWKLKIFVVTIISTKNQYYFKSDSFICLLNSLSFRVCPTFPIWFEFSSLWTNRQLETLRFKQCRFTRMRKFLVLLVSDQIIIYFNYRGLADLLLSCCKIH